MLGEMAIQVVNGHATANGVLAGSVLTLDRALQNFVAYTGATVESALPLLTHNPAAMTGFSDLAGAIRIGEPANLVALDSTGVLVASIIQGQIQ
jgi:N-acetylglucosamine-6-phosphate deacetylase